MLFDFAIDYFYINIYFFTINTVLLFDKYNNWTSRLKLSKNQPRLHLELQFYISLSYVYQLLIYQLSEFHITFLEWFLGILLDFLQFIVNYFVKHFLSYSVRGAIFFAVSVVAVAVIFKSYRLVLPISFLAYEGTTAVTTFQ